MRLNEALLRATSDAAIQVLRLDGPADRRLSAFFRANPRIGQQDRGVIADTLYAILRRKRWLEWLLGPVSARQLVLAGMLLLREQKLAVLEPMVGPNEAKWLRTIAAHVHTEDDIPLAVALELPDWIVERLQKVMPEPDLRTLAAALTAPAPLDLRVNEFRGDRASVLAVLAAARIKAAATPYSPLGIRVEGKPAINRLPVFLDGSVEVQDEGSQLVCALVGAARGEMVVDFCAGAGGKTLALGAMMRSTGRVYAFDTNDTRLAKLKPRLARSGLSNVHPQRIDGERDPRVARLAGKIDRVLLDVPCSGLGTLRRNPDLKWRQSPQSLDELRAKQASILKAAARLAKIGGRLVYATCSLLTEENEAIVEAFLAEQSTFRLINAWDELAKRGVTIAPDGSPYLRLFPHRHGTDGFFAAVLERIA